LECHLCVFGKLVAEKLWRFWLWCGWIKWVVKNELEYNTLRSIDFVFRSFFLLSRCTFSLCFFEVQCSRFSLDRKFIVFLCPYIKLSHELVLLHKIKWPLTWRWWFVEREKITLFMGDGLDS
jgi:hypothetical protein